MALTDDGKIYTWGGTLGGKRGGGKEIRAAGIKFEPTLLQYFTDKNLRVTAIACG